MIYLLVLLGVWIYLRYLGPIFISFKKTQPNSRRPTRAYGKAACWDVYATENVSIPVGQWREVSFGLIIAPWPHVYIPFLKLSITPFGNVATKIHTRSGLAIRKGLRNHLGIIDNDYRKELSAVMFNHGTYPVRIKAGDKIAQLEFYRVPTALVFQQRKLSISERGDRGHGSSGQ